MSDETSTEAAVIAELAVLAMDSNTIDGFGVALYMTGHQTGSAVGDYANASTFTRMHIDCPTSGGSPITGTYGINLVEGDGNTWVGGDELLFPSTRTDLFYGLGVAFTDNDLKILLGSAPSIK